MKKLNIPVNLLFANNIDTTDVLQQIEVINKVKRLARKHHRLCEMSCNGEGWVNGTYYSTSSNNKNSLFHSESAYINNEETTIFDIEAEKIEKKINKLINKLVKNTNLDANYQYDPRGATVKLFLNKVNITDLIV